MKNFAFFFAANLPPGDIHSLRITYYVYVRKCGLVNLNEKFPPKILSHPCNPGKTGERCPIPSVCSGVHPAILVELGIKESLPQNCVCLHNVGVKRLSSRTSGCAIFAPSFFIENWTLRSFGTKYFNPFPCHDSHSFYGARTSPFISSGHSLAFLFKLISLQFSLIYIWLYSPWWGKKMLFFAGKKTEQAFSWPSKKSPTVLFLKARMYPLMRNEDPIFFWDATFRTYGDFCSPLSPSFYYWTALLSVTVF